MKRTQRALHALSALIVVLGAAAAYALTDAEVRAAIIQESLQGYPGNCPCPYNTDRAGRRCGGRSAWSKPGGYTPICFPDEVSDAQVRAWRARNGG
jgi:hypothetical protein